MQQVLGSASIRRVGVLGFPISFLVGEDGQSGEKVLARLGRGGWFRVFFGRGRRVELPDGTIWRMTARGIGHYIVPVVTCEAGKLAEAAPRGKRAYGINGRDFAYNLYPDRRVGWLKPTWSLSDHDTELASFGSNSIFADHPIPLAAALLGLTLVKYGVPGEADLGIPRFRW